MVFGIFPAEVASLNTTATLISNTFTVSNLTIGNGQSVRVTVVGVNPTQPAPNPGTVVQCYVGGNGNTVDQLVSTCLVPPQIGGPFLAEFLLTCRANNKGGAATGNSIWTSACISQLQSYGTGLGLVSPLSLGFPTSNGNVNVAYNQTAAVNTLNVTVYVTTASGVNATSLIEQCAVQLIA